MTLDIHSLFEKKLDGRVGELRLCIQEKLCWTALNSGSSAKCTDRQWQSQFALRCDSGIRATPMPQFRVKWENIWGWTEDDCHMLVDLNCSWTSPNLYEDCKILLDIYTGFYLQWGLGTGKDRNSPWEKYLGAKMPGKLRAAILRD